MAIGRASRRRASRRRKRINVGDLTRGNVWQMLSCWQREAEHRARVAFEESDKQNQDQVVPAVWALYRAKVVEARTMQELYPEIAAVEELREYCRRAVARYMDPRMIRLGPSRPKVPA